MEIKKIHKIKFKGTRLKGSLSSQMLGSKYLPIDTERVDITLTYTVISPYTFFKK